MAGGGAHLCAGIAPFRTRTGASGRHALTCDTAVCVLTCNFRRPPNSLSLPNRRAPSRNSALPLPPPPFPRLCRIPDLLVSNERYGPEKRRLWGHFFARRRGGGGGGGGGSRSGGGGLGGGGGSSGECRGCICNRRRFRRRRRRRRRRGKRKRKRRRRRRRRPQQQRGAQRLYLQSKEVYSRSGERVGHVTCTARGLLSLLSEKKDKRPRGVQEEG